MLQRSFAEIRVFCHQSHFGHAPHKPLQLCVRADSESSHAVYKGKTTLDSFDLKWEGNHGRATAVATAAPVNPYGGAVDYGDTTITFDVDFAAANGNIQVMISNVSYVVNCKNKLSSGTTYDCVVEDIFIVKDVGLKDVLAATTYKEDMKSPDWYAEWANQYLENRYSTQYGGSAKEVTSTFDVDFVTAKARLQRKATDNFKYDNETSAFTFTKKFNAQRGAKSLAEHTVVASLFPDRNKTVVVFSGKYNHYKDVLDIENLASQKDFDVNMKDMMKLVKESLSE